MVVSASEFCEKIKPITSFRNKIQLKIILVYINSCNVFLSSFKTILFKKNDWESNRISKILIFRTGSIGDTICALPAIVNIKNRFPNVRIDILTNTGSSNFVSIEKLLSKDYYHSIIDYLGVNPFRLWKKIKANRYDLIIQMPQSFAPGRSQFRDMFFFRTTGIKYGFGWQKSSTLVFKKMQERFIVQKRETDILLDMIHRNGIHSQSNNHYPLNIEKQDKLFVKSDFIDLKIDLTKPIVAVVIGAKRLQNRWPLDYFRKLIKYLSENSIQVIIIGSTDDFVNASALIFPNVWNMCGRYTPLQSAEAFAYCRLTVTNDTGPMHLAYAMGTPVIALFSSRDFQGRWFPPLKDSENKVFRTNNVHCALCLSENCTDNICMKAIKPDEVINAIKQLLPALN